MNKKARSGIVSLCLAALASCPAPAFAGEGEDVRTRDVVVTATRTEQDVKAAPMSVQIITAADIARKGAVTLRQALEGALNIYVDQDGMNRGTVTMRGFGARHTLILVDGKRLTGESGLGSANSFDLDRIRLENVARVEIVRGPASSLYGSDAMGGVINIITKNPQQPELNLDVESKLYSGGDNAGYNWHLRYDGGKRGKFGWTMSAGEKEDKPYFLANGETGNYYGTRRPFAFKGVWEPDAKRRVIFDADTLSEEVEKKTAASGQLQRAINRNDRANYSLAYEGRTAGGDYQFRVYQSIYEKDYEQRTAAGVLRSFDAARRETTAGEFKVSREWQGNHLFTYGGEYRNEWIRGTRINTGTGAYQLSREGKTSQGSVASLAYSALYVQDEWQLSDRVLLIPSLRYDGSSKFDAAWSPKLGITYRLAANSRLKAAYGHGFRPPTPTELYHSFRMHPGWLWEGNPGLQPEKSRSGEIGWEWEQGPRSGKITYFRSSLSDYIDYYYTGRTQGGSRVYSYANVASATMSGVETQVSQRLGDCCRASLTYAYLDAVDDKTGWRLNRRPRHKIGAELAYTGKTGDVTGSLSGFWLSGLLDDSIDPVQERSYAIWNLMLNKRLTGNATLYAGVDNFTNTKVESLWINGAVYRVGMRFTF